jgi:hypothetical protein
VSATFSMANREASEIRWKLGENAIVLLPSSTSSGPEYRIDTVRLRCSFAAMSITTKIKELNEARATVAQLEQVVAAELNSELAALPAQYGFASVADFVAAFEKAAGKRRGRKPGKAKAEAAPTAAAKPEASAKKKRRTRAVITDATRDEVKKLVAAGKTGAEIAKAVGISVPSVQNIKKALGLVGKPGKAKAEASPATEAKPKVAAKPVATVKPKAPAKTKRRKRSVKTDATKAGVKAG